MTKLYNRHGHKLTDDISVQELVELREQGNTLKEIGEMLGVSDGAISYYTKGMVNRKDKFASKGINAEYVMEQLKMGRTYSDIASQLGVSTSAIGQAKKRYEKARLKHPVLDEEQYAACKAHIEEKKAEGSKPSELAMQMYADAQAAKEAKANEPLKKTRLKVENIVTRVTGEAGCYTIDMSKREVSSERWGVWKFEELAALLGDIAAIKEEVHA